MWVYFVYLSCVYASLGKMQRERKIAAYYIREHVNKLYLDPFEIMFGKIWASYQIVPWKCYHQKTFDIFSETKSQYRYYILYSYTIISLKRNTFTENISKVNGTAIKTNNSQSSKASFHSRTIFDFRSTIPLCLYPSDTVRRSSRQLCRPNDVTHLTVTF